jgi:hypothetical protein
MHCKDNLQVGKLVSDAITALPPINVDLLVHKPPIVSCVHKSNTVVVKNG